jgi:hypothetical protein
MKNIILESMKHIAIAAIPLYGDYKIHQIFSKERKKIRNEYDAVIKPREKEFDERENKFIDELKSLKMKYGIFMSFSVRPDFVAYERSSFGNRSILGTNIPELLAYSSKYISYYELYSQFFN